MIRNTKIDTNTVAKIAVSDMTHLLLPIG